MCQGGDTVVLYDELAFQDVLPVQWRPLPVPFDAYALQGLEDTNSVLLQACVAVEDGTVRDRKEESGPLAGEIARLEFKLNLVLQLLGRLAAGELMPPPAVVQLNARGARWRWAQSEPIPLVGAHGLLRIRLRGSLPQPLEWPADVTQVTESEVQARFTPWADATAGLIQKLAFLRHRRYVAGSRRAPQS